MRLSTSISFVSLVAATVPAAMPEGVVFDIGAAASSGRSSGTRKVAVAWRGRNSSPTQTMRAARAPAVDTATRAVRGLVVTTGATSLAPSADGARSTHAKSATGQGPAGPAEGEAFRTHCTVASTPRGVHGSGLPNKPSLARLADRRGVPHRVSPPWRGLRVA